MGVLCTGDIKAVVFPTQDTLKYGTLNLMIKRHRRKGRKKGKLFYNWISDEKKQKLLKLFALKSTAVLAAKDVGVSRQCTNKWFNHFREKIFEHTGVAPRFSGEVEIDVTNFRSRSAKKRKYWKETEERMGGLDPDWYRRMEAAKAKKPQKPKRLVAAIMQRGGRVWCWPIPDQKTETIMPVIHMVVEEGSTIYTDEGASLKAIANDPGYVHKTINHSERFSDEKGVHINSVEQFFSSAKRRLRKFRGLRGRQFILHIKESEFRYNLRDNPSALQKELQRIINLK